MRAVLAHALARLARRRGRALLAMGGVTAAAAMLGAALTVGYGLSTGFDRSATRAHLPDAIARFNSVPLRDVESRASALPNVRALAYRLESSGEHVAARGQSNDHATLEGIRPGPRGYAITSGRDLSGRADEAVVERGLARAWHLRAGDTLEISDSHGGEARLRVVGVGVAPETVAFPLTRGPRLYVPYETVRRLAGAADGQVNTVLLWARDPRRLDVTLAQARAASYGLADLRFVTRAGTRVLIGQAAGIVIALLVAFSVVALGAAGVMLAASASAEVQRRLPAIGILRALGASPGEVAAGYAAEAVLIGAPAGALGLLLGWLLVRGPTERLLEAVNELAPGASLAGLLAAALAGIVALLAAASAWPAWRAARRRPAEVLKGADVAGTPRRLFLPAGALGLGMRLALARPTRTGAAALVLAASASVVLLMLTIASLLQSLQHDPHAVGKRYQLTVPAPADEAARIARLRGVLGAAPRYELDAADSFDLGESFRVIAFPGDHTRYEAPPLDEGRRVAAADEVEVGVGLAEALNLHPGATLAVQLPSGSEARFRVVGVVRALENEGRVAYVRPAHLLAAAPYAQPTIAVRTAPGSTDAVRTELRRIGLVPEDASGVAGDAVQGWAARNGGFVAVLVALLRSVAVLDGLVCLYALVQMLALTAQERRQAVAAVRALGGSSAQVRRIFAGSALLVAALAAPAGVALERVLVGPAVSRLAASYVSLPLGAGLVQIVVVAAGLVAASLAAAAWVARSATSRPVVAGLADE